MILDWLIPILVFVAVVTLGGAIVLGVSGRRSLRARLSSGPGQPDISVAAPEPAVVRAANAARPPSSRRPPESPSTRSPTKRAETRR